MKRKRRSIGLSLNLVFPKFLIHILALL